MWHLTMATDGRVPLARTEAEVRCVVRRVVGIRGSPVLLFCVVDDHLHVVICADRRGAGRFANALRRSVRAATGAALDPVRIRPVNGRSHLVNLVRYVVEQPAHHGLVRGDALSWSGSCLPDLVGARELPVDLAGAVQLELPRWQVGQLLGELGAPTSIGEVPFERVRELGAARLAAAAAAAYCAPPDLGGERSWTRRARRAAVQVGRAAEIAPTEIAHALRIDVDSVHRLARRPPLDHAARLIRRRLWLEGLASAAA